MKLLKKTKIAITIFLLSVFSLGLMSLDDDSNFEIVKNLDIFYTLFKELNTFYVDEVDPSKLVETGIDKMLKSLDPYTVYIPEADMEDYKFMTTGQYGGIGAVIRKSDDYIVVSQPYEDSPAIKAGLKAGDKIVEIDGKTTKDKSTSQISNLLKGQPNTAVELLIRRPYVEGDFKVELIREEIQVKSVDYYGMVSDSIGYIYLTNFTNKAGAEVKEAFIDLKENKGAKAVILDLRGNPGGLLIEAVKIVNIFVNKGEEIVSTKGKISQWDKTYKGMWSPLDTLIPVAVLVNSSSASASEIVSGAIQDLDRGVVLGTRTFGKGLVQTTRDLSYNTKLKVTTAKYYIPSGRCIQALDYSHRNEDGSVGKIPDSLITEFKTRNGRLVYDGGGVRPDIKVEPEHMSKIAASLMFKYFIFDYATKYASEHKEIPPVGEFEFTDKDYDDFISFLSGKDFDYETRSEDKLDKLLETAKREKYFSLAEEEFAALKKKLAHDKDKDLIAFKSEIKQLIEEEIVSRYYMQEGRIKLTLMQDSVTAKAIEVLSNPNLYQDILTGKYKEEDKDIDETE